jgi:hypothetical protein
LSSITKKGEIVSAIKPIVGFGVDDHRIRELMIFDEMTSRELRTEDVKQFDGSPIQFEKAFIEEV